MIQRRWVRRDAVASVLLACVTLVAVVACDKPREAASPDNASGAAPPPQAAARVSPTFASLVPSVTDLLLAMGLGDHLVAVSNYCYANPAAAGLPAVGDYQTTDWERLSTLRPDVLVVFSTPDRLPPGMVSRARQLGIRLEPLRTDHIDDVRAAMRRLGELAGRPELAERAVGRLDQRLAAVRQRVAGRPAVPTLILIGDHARGGVGQGGFLDELLTLAGGRNVAADLGTPYPQLDREQRVSLAPAHILHLLPAASPAQVRAAEQFWATQPELRPGSAVRVTLLTQWYLLQPGGHLADIAEHFADALHGDPGTAALDPLGRAEGAGVNAHGGGQPAAGGGDGR